MTFDRIGMIIITYDGSNYDDIKICDRTRMIRIRITVIMMLIVI